MAGLARYGNVQPSEFERMDERDALRLARQLDELRRGDDKVTVEYVKVLARAAATGRAG